LSASKFIFHGRARRFIVDAANFLAASLFLAAVAALAFRVAG
jgi:hypothetical protein